METEVIKKLDYRLGRLLHAGGLDEAEQIPIIVRLKDPESIDGMVDFVQSRAGRLRHRLPIVNAFSAWVDLRLLELLSVQQGVVALEFVDWTEIARDPM